MPHGQPVFKPLYFKSLERHPSLPDVRPELRLIEPCSHNVFEVSYVIREVSCIQAGQIHVLERADARYVMIQHKMYSGEYFIEKSKSEPQWLKNHVCMDLCFPAVFNSVGGIWYELPGGAFVCAKSPLKRDIVSASLDVSVSMATEMANSTPDSQELTWASRSHARMQILFLLDTHTCTHTHTHTDTGRGI